LLSEFIMAVLVISARLPEGLARLALLEGLGRLPRSPKLEESALVEGLMARALGGLTAKPPLLAIALVVGRPLPGLFPLIGLAKAADIGLVDPVGEDLPLSMSASWRGRCLRLSNSG